MDPSSYKSVTTKRGLKYSYYFSPGDSAKPPLIFLHGFPSTSYDWRHQVAFFKAKGFTVIVPDLLGYGGTDKPTDVASYKHSGMAADVIDILDAEGVAPGKAIAIAHDWGCGLLSRVANYYPERFLGFAFLAVGYSAPSARSGDFSALLAQMKSIFGYELFGYWQFFSEDGADKIIEERWDSFVSILYPSDPVLWKTDMAPVGAIKAWLLADKKAPRPSYVTEEDIVHVTKTIRDRGLAGPLNWYKVMTSGLAAEDNKQISEDKCIIQQPVFYGAAMKDYICLPAVSKQSMPKLCPKLTWYEFDADHWVQLAKADDVNRELLAWIEGVDLTASL